MCRHHPGRSATDGSDRIPVHEYGKTEIRETLLPQAPVAATGLKPEQCEIPEDAIAR